MLLTVLSGITKLNADIQAITSPLHLKTQKLTKKDLLILYGGTKYISRNEINKGICSLKDFAHRTLNTNIIVLGALHRYDLPSSSCMNTEVKLYSKKLQGLMSTFNHVRVLSMPTERNHHNNHGLHLNKKGKDWIVNNLVKEIRNLYLPGKTSPPIMLPWREVKEKDDLGYQFLAVTANGDTEHLSANSGNDCQQFGDSAVLVDFLPNINVECLRQTTEACNDPQEDVTIHKSKRLKKLPTNKYQDFLC